MKTLAFAAAAWLMLLPENSAQVYGGGGIPGVTRRIIMQPLPAGYALPGAVVATNPQHQQGTSAPAPAAALPAAPQTARAVVYAPRPMDPLKAQAARDEAEAKTIAFQKKKAQDGAAWAQYDLGVRYLTGAGVEQDIDKGREWLEKAAAQNDTKARRKLDELRRVIAEAERTLAARQKTKVEEPETTQSSESR